MEQATTLLVLTRSNQISTHRVKGAARSAAVRVRSFIAATGRFFLKLPPGPGAWGGTTLKLADGLPGGNWKDILTGRTVKSQKGGLPVGDLFADLPIALLEPA